MVEYLLFDFRLLKQEKILGRQSTGAEHRQKNILLQDSNKIIFCRLARLLPAQNFYT